MQFIRTQMLPPMPPPATERGAIKWLRENLFSSWLNAILTLLALAVIYYLASLSLPWLLHGVWVANSLGECRSIISQSFGPEADGACWAVIRSRWYQWIYGFYPQDFHLIASLFYPDQFAAAGGYDAILGPNANPAAEDAFVEMIRANSGWFVLNILGYWRPELAFLLLFVALAPVLFEKVPRGLFGVTILYPFVAVFLIWGGSAWGPLTTLLGFGILGLAYRLLSGRLGLVMATTAGVVAAIVWWLLLQGFVADALQAVIPLDIQAVPSDKLGGFLLAFVIGVSSISISLPIGVLLALGRQSDMALIKSLSVGFIEFVRGVPLITMLFTASLLLQYFLPPQVQFDLILRVVILVTLFSAAYIAEVIRGGLAALPKGQYEAADALGLDYWQAQRLIIMPQALKVSIPGIVSTFIGLFKDTTLVTFVGLQEPLKGITSIVRADIAWKGIYWEPYIFVGAIFFAACYGMSRYSLYLERKLETDHR